MLSTISSAGSDCGDHRLGLLAREHRAHRDREVRAGGVLGRGEFDA
jgi:hypothetical protein